MHGHGAQAGTQRRWCRYAAGVTPLCHQVGVETFRLATGVDLRDAAVRLEMEWQAMNATSEAA